MKMIIEGTPKFKTEQQEADWWDANQDIVTELFQRAAGECASNAQGQPNVPRIRLTAEDIAKAKTPASTQNVDHAVNAA